MMSYFLYYLLAWVVIHIYRYSILASTESDKQRQIEFLAVAYFEKVREKISRKSAKPMLLERVMNVITKITDTIISSKLKMIKRFRGVSHKPLGGLNSHLYLKYTDSNRDMCFSFFDKYRF
jgi:hypothetical protein